MSLPKIVIDTNVLIAAQRSRRGASSKLLSLIGTGLFEVYISVALILEYEYVMMEQRPHLGLTQEDVSDLLDAICALANHQEQIHFQWRPQLRDTDDEFILEVAIAERCEYIVTFNTKNFVEARDFGIEVMSPNLFLKAIGGV
ncbi:MAG: putative toxin-antitoxin system toxin component, PIN family [Chloroflexota bacterium]